MTDYNLDNPVERKIKDRMDKLQDWMETNYHLKNPDEVKELISSVSKFWRVMQEEDQDYIHGCSHAIEENMEWK